jgi:uncharacterized protein (DUF169 family)
MSEVIASDLTTYDWPELVDQLNRYLRLRTTPIGMKLFETVEEMEAIPRIRRPSAIHTTDQIVGQASRNGWTVGITAKDLVGAQCSTVIGLHPRSDDWLSGDRMAGVWYADQEEASKHQHAMDVVPYGKFEAMAVSPLAAKRLDPPDICLIYRPAVDGLQQARLGVCRRVGLCRFLGSCVSHRRAQRVHTMLCRTALRRGYGR